MSRLRFTKVQTMGGSRPMTFFCYYDIFALEAFINASSDLINLPDAMFQVTFQIIDATTNQVVFNRPILAPFIPDEGENFWMLLGERRPDHQQTTPFDFGLLSDWRAPWSGQGVFGFRAIIQSYQVVRIPPELTPEEGPGEFLTSLGDFDVSDTVWFKIDAPSISPSIDVHTARGIAGPCGTSGRAVADLIGSGDRDFWPGHSHSVPDDAYPGDIYFRRGSVRNYVKWIISNWLDKLGIRSNR